VVIINKMLTGCFVLGGLSWPLCCRILVPGVLAPGVLVLGVAGTGNPDGLGIRRPRSGLRLPRLPRGLSRVVAA
jgi:hypothetical protein